MSYRTLPGAVAALVVALVLTGCEGCIRETGPDNSYGEVLVVYPVDGVLNEGRNARFDFGSVFALQQATVKVVIKNVGRAGVTLASLEKVEGAPVVIGANGEPGAVWTIPFEPTSLSTSETVEFEAVFTPPDSAGPVDYSVTLVLRVQNAKPGEQTATITFTGRGIQGFCELPTTIDFGSVAVGDEGAHGFVIANPSQISAEATVAEVTSSSGDHAAFAFAPESLRGTVVLEPESSREVAFEFRPTEQKSYLAFVRARASAQCPEQNITLTGRGVDQVLTWTPAQLDCGYVSPGTEAKAQITLSNAGARDVTLARIRTLNTVEFSPDVTTLLVPAATPSEEGTWAPGAATIEVTCKPAVLGLRQTSLQFDISLPKQPSGAVAVKAYGGGPEIELKPSTALNFGKVAYFAGATPASFHKKKVTVLNVGTKPVGADAKANLHLGQPDGSGGYQRPWVEVVVQEGTLPGEITVAEPANYDPAVGIEATAGVNARDLVVTVTPVSLGQKKAELRIYSNDGDEPVTTITILADAVELPPCDYVVTPTALEFGLISPPHHRDLAFTIQNRGTNPGDVCLLSTLEVGTQSQPEAFSLPGGDISQRELLPGETLEVPVRVWPQGQTPQGVTQLSGAVDFFMSSPTQPQATVTLAAQLAPSCLTIAPAELDYGAVEIGCSSATRSFNIYNTCSSPVTLHSFALQAAAGQPAGGPDCPGTTPCPEFLLVQSPAIPSGGLILSAGQPPQTFQVKYRPIDVGPDTGAVAISALQNGTTVTYVVSLRGKGGTDGVQTDVFTQDAKPKADILLVIDDSGSMGDEQQSLAANFQSFIKYAQSAKVDYRIAVTTTDMSPSGAQGRFVSAATHPEKILTPSTLDVESKFKAKVNVGVGGSATEMGFEPALKALTAPLINGDNAGFLRPEAALAVAVITDEAEQSPNPVSYYLNGFWNIKGFNRKTQFTFNVIGGFSPGCVGDSGEYAQMVHQTNGVKNDICTPDWSKTLEELGKTVFGFRTNFFLTSAPDTSKGPIEVRIDGNLIPAIDDRGATVWTYDSVATSVNFEPMYVPEPGQTLTITYPVTCYP